MIKNLIKDMFNTKVERMDKNNNLEEITSGEQLDSYNQIDEINKQYIDAVYGDDLIYPLMGQRGKDRDVYSFYINKNNAMDIKLPFEFLSPIKTLESNHDNILFELNVDDNYEHFLIHYDYSLPLSLGKPSHFDRWSNSKDYRNFSLLNYGGGIEYDFTYNYHIDKEKLKEEAESGEAIIKLIDTYNLHSESIIDYYIALIKKNQPTIDEMINILIKFEKSKESLSKVKVIDESQTLNTMLENSVSRDNNKFDNIDKELLSLVQYENKSRNNKELIISD